MKSLTLKKIITIILWVGIACFLYDRGLITLRRDLIMEYINESQGYSWLLFIFLSCTRIFVFIPGVIFMVVSGVIFGSIKGFILSMISMVIGQTLVYFLARIFTFRRIRNKLDQKYPYIQPLIREYDYKFLGLGILTPIAPTDVICFLSCVYGIRYIKYITTVIIANIPMMLVYCSMGEGFKNSMFSIVLMIGSIIMCSIITIQVWLKLKNGVNKENVDDKTSMS